MQCERVMFSTDIHKMRCLRGANYEIDGEKLCAQHAQILQTKAWRRRNVWLEKTPLKKAGKP